MSPTRKLALAAGVLYFVTHVTSVAALPLYDPVLNDPGFVLGSGAGTQVLLGAFLEVILAMAVAGTAVTLYPVVKRQHEGIALGYVGLRTLEAAIIAVGVVSLLAVVTLRDQGSAGGTDTAALVGAAHALVAVHEWAFLLGPSLVLGVNTVLMAYLMYRSGLVPKFIGLLGLVGGPLVFASGTATLFGLFEQVSVVAAIAAAPVFAWEVSLAGWLVAKGFSNAPGTPAVNGREGSAHAPAARPCRV